MNWKKLSFLIFILLICDQVLKIWIKTHLQLNDAIVIFPDWFQLHFIENNGAAFGMQLSTGTGIDWGKILLSFFRVGMICFLGWFMHRLITRKAPTGVLLGLAFIFAGALGNLIDSAFYGMFFSASTPATVAHFGGSYAGFMMGKVVDMFYFPLFQWNGVPQWLSFLVDSNNYFFGAIFNLADAYISVAVFYMLIFQYKFINSEL
ncbi:MAG: signal peptidase II [Alistipes sp.]